MRNDLGRYRFFLRLDSANADVMFYNATSRLVKVDIAMPNGRLSPGKSA